MTEIRPDLIDRVAAAWLEPGPRPDVHAAAQAKLRAEWPALAEAVAALAAWNAAVR